MSLRTRIALAAALAVIVAFGVGGFVTYQAAQRSLYGEVDASLRAAALREGHAALNPDSANPDRGFGGNANGRFGAPGIFTELINGQGEIVRLPRNETPLPPTKNGTRPLDAISPIATSANCLNSAALSRSPGSIISIK